MSDSDSEIERILRAGRAKNDVEAARARRLREQNEAYVAISNRAIEAYLGLIKKNSFPSLPVYTLGFEEGEMRGKYLGEGWAASTILTPNFYNQTGHILNEAGMHVYAEDRESFNLWKGLKCTNRLGVVINEEADKNGLPPKLFVSPNNEFTNIMDTSTMFTTPDSQAEMGQVALLYLQGRAFEEEMWR